MDNLSQKINAGSLGLSDVELDNLIDSFLSGARDAVAANRVDGERREGVLLTGDKYGLRSRVYDAFIREGFEAVWVEGEDYIPRNVYVIDIDGCLDSYFNGVNNKIYN